MKSSQKVLKFLESAGVHKKDFAEMVGVTLSYVYNLTDSAIAFSTRATTLERIAAVMDIKPEEFEEYKIPQEPVVIDEGVVFLKDAMHKKKISAVEFLKSFPRKNRLKLVDMLRGVSPVPIDFKELAAIADVLGLTKKDMFAIWEKRMRQVFESNGMNMGDNAALVESMFECAKKNI